MNGRLLTVFILVICVGIVFALGVWARPHLAPESAPVARGAAYAGIRGCVDCHGYPDKPLLDANDEACSDVNNQSAHPDYSVDCSDVLSYFEVVRLRRSFDSRVEDGKGGLLINGEALAREYHCFQCHGPLGQGGFANAKSLKGYVPGYFGNDFRALTRSADLDSVRQWIMNGLDSSIVEKPFTGKIAEFFFEREEVSMPSYRSLPPEELETLANYVIAINKFGPMSADVVRSYGAATMHSAKEN